MSRITTCPHCSKHLQVSEQVTDKTLICPHCLGDVENAWPGSQIRVTDINTDVKRNLSVGSNVLRVLIGLCTLGSLMVLAVLRHGEAEIIRAFYLSIFFGALDILLSIAIIRGIVRWGVSGIRTPSAGRVVGIILLSLGTIAAIVVFFFCTCMLLIG